MKEIILVLLAIKGAQKIAKEVGRFALTFHMASLINPNVADELKMAIAIIEKEQKKAVAEGSSKQYQLELQRLHLMQAYEKLSRNKRR